MYARMTVVSGLPMGRPHSRVAPQSGAHAQWRSGAVTGRRGYPPRLRNGSPRRQVVTLWYPPRTIEYGSRFPGKAAGRGVTADGVLGLLPLSLFRCGLLSHLRPIGHCARARPRTYTPRTYMLHTTTTCTCTECTCTSYSPIHSTGARRAWLRRRRMSQAMALRARRFCTPL